MKAMKKRLSMLYLVVAAGVALTACSGPSSPQATAPAADLPSTVPAEGAASTPLPAAPVAQVGQQVANLGAVLTVSSVTAAKSIPLNESNYRPGSGYEKYTDTPAGDGAKYVVVVTRVTNNAKTSMDLTCSLPIATKLLDNQGRQYDSIDDLYKIKNNPECNKSLQPGFADDMTWIYRVPETATITAWSFQDTTDFSTLNSNQPSFVQVAVS